MRLTVIGQAAFGEAVLKRLQDDGHEIAAVSAPPPKGDRPDPLWQAAAAAGIETIPTGELKDQSQLGRLEAADADVAVMAFVTDILPEEVFELPARGTIQYHPSLLPRHRGSSAMNWPIIFGETETGLTVFWPDKGIDTGPILLQKRQPIGPDETMGSLYFNHLFPMGVDALSEAVWMVEKGTAPRIGQDHSLATYEPPCTERHGEIAWHRPASEIYALIRGCNPQPGAWTTYQGEKVKIFDCELLRTPEPGMPGRVLRIDTNGIAVRLNGGVLHVKRVQPAGGKKVSAAEWAKEAGLAEGYRFR